MRSARFTALLVTAACSAPISRAPHQEAHTAVPSIIFDTDMATDVDDVGALALLHALANRREARIAAIGVSESVHSYDGQWAVPMVDILDTHFGRPDIPIGIYKGPHQARSFRGRYAEAISSRPFPRRGHRAENVEEAYRLYRRVLTAAPDGSVVLVSVGYLTNVAALLRSVPDDVSPLTGYELVRRKVRLWSCMGGQYPASDDNGEANFRMYPGDTRYSLDGWPTRIVFTGFELGTRFRTGTRVMQTGGEGPVALAFRMFGGGQPRASWDEIATLYAVRGRGPAGAPYFELRDGGSNRFELLPTFSAPIPIQRSRNEWVASPDKGQAYLVARIEPHTLEAIMDELIAAPPR